MVNGVVTSVGVVKWMVVLDAVIGGVTYITIGRISKMKLEGSSDLECFNKTES